MITPAFIACVVLFFALTVVTRIVFDRARTPTGGIRWSIAAPMIPLLFGAGALAVGAFMRGSIGTVDNRAAAVLAGFSIVAVAGIVAAVIGPFIAELIADPLIGALMGRPSDRAMKHVNTFDRARGLALRGKLEEAATEYAAELAKDPAQPHGYKEWADVLDKLGRLEEAAGVLLRSLPHVEDVEQRALVRLRVVDLHRQVGNIDVARSLLEEMLKEPWPPRIERAIRSRRDHLPP